MTVILSVEERTQIRELLRTITPGRWFIEGHNVMNETRSHTLVLLPKPDGPEDDANAEFIASAPTLVARLLDALETALTETARLAASNDAARWLLDRIPDSRDDGSLGSNAWCDMADAWRNGEIPVHPETETAPDD